MVKTVPDLQRQRGDDVRETTAPDGDQVRTSTTTNCFGLRQRWQDTEYRNKLLRSWCITLSFFTLGITIGQVGATLLDLQLITGTSLEEASAFVTVFTAGNMAGAFISGAVFDKVNNLLFLFTGVFGTGVTAIISPYMTSYPLMIFIRGLSGIFDGIIEAGGNAAQMKLWRNEGKVVIQTMHFAFSLGGVVVPLYTEPFLAKRIMANEIPTDNVTTGNVSRLSPSSDFEKTNVHYAFLITGVVLMLTSVPFVVLFIKQRSPVIQTISEKNENIKITYRELPCCVHIFTLTNICIFFLLYCCIEMTFSFFLMAFLINEFDSLTTSESVYITTVLWVSFALTRFIMIFVSKMLSSIQLLSLCLIAMLVAYTGFFISVILNSTIAVVVFTAIIGLGMSSVFPAGISWVESEVMKVTPRVSSSVSITASTGRIIVPVIIGFLMGQVSNWWFCYIVLGQTVLICLNFIFMFLFNRYFLNKVYGLLIEKQITEHGQDQLLTKRLNEENETLTKP